MSWVSTWVLVTNYQQSSKWPLRCSGIALVDFCTSSEIAWIGSIWSSWRKKHGSCSCVRVMAFQRLSVWSRWVQVWFDARASGLIISDMVQLLLRSTLWCGPGQSWKHSRSLFSVLFCVAEALMRVFVSRWASLTCTSLRYTAWITGATSLQNCWRAGMHSKNSKTNSSLASWPRILNLRYPVCWSVYPRSRCN